MKDRPNLVFVFADQWREQAFGHARDVNASTPRIDAFSRRCAHMSSATAGVPVCGPHRASLLTGQYPLTHGAFVNDQILRGNPVGLGGALAEAGYAAAYIGKWHVNGRGRKGYVEPRHRLGFEFWRGFECSHDYWNSPYWDERGGLRHWAGYDAFAQAEMACGFIEAQKGGPRPFALFLSWGPPHDPYDTAPPEFRARFDPNRITLRENVPAERAGEARRLLAGYYAHGSALDQAFGRILDHLARLGLEENTIVVFTSDHGDMLCSQGLRAKQVPYEESVRIPFLMRWPAGGVADARVVDTPFGAPDIMPSLLGLLGASIPGGVEGVDHSAAWLGRGAVETPGVLLASYCPFHQYSYARGGREYRGLRTRTHTYCRDLTGPWLLFDNRADPFQLRNLLHEPAAAPIRDSLDAELAGMLRLRRDPFRPGVELLREYDVVLNDEGDVAIGRQASARDEQAARGR